MFFAKRNTKKKTSASIARLGSVRTPTQVVTNQRWVHRSQLEIGMYVNELDTPWEQTSFMFQGFVIDNAETLHQVQDSCEYAFVHTQKLARISPNHASRLVGS